MVEVFKTNIVDKADAEKITFELHQLIPMTRINFDLDDCDRILRVEFCSQHVVTCIQEHLQREGFVCEPLE